MAVKSVCFLGLNVMRKAIRVDIMALNGCDLGLNGSWKTDGVERV